MTKNRHCKLKILLLLYMWGDARIFVVQSLSHIRLFATPWTIAYHASLFHYLLKFAETRPLKSLMPSNHLLLCCLLLLLPSIIPSIRVFSNELTLCISWPKYWKFSFSLSPSNEYWKIVSLWIAWFIFLLSKALSRVFFSTGVWNHQFFGTQPFLWSSADIGT